MPEWRLRAYPHQLIVIESVTAVAVACLAQADGVLEAFMPVAVGSKRYVATVMVGGGGLPNCSQNV